MLAGLDPARAGPSAYDEFSVERRESQTVLDVVTEIQREQDATPELSLRLPRRHVRLLRHDGERHARAGPAARASPRSSSRKWRLVLEPLRNLPVIKDLAVEMTPFFEKWRDAKGFFEPGETPPRDFVKVPPASRARQAADEGIECINCGVCYSACDVVAWNPDYLGPAALNRAWTLAQRCARRGAGGAACRGFRPRRLPVLPHAYELHELSARKASQPTYAIAGLKRMAMRGALGRKGGER